MFKGGFNLVQNGAIDFIQPHHDQQYWDFGTTGFTGGNPVPNYSKQTVNNNNGCNTTTSLERNEHSQLQWVEHFNKQVVDEDHQPETSMDYEDNIVPTAPLGELRPQKTSRKSETFISNETIAVVAGGHQNHHHYCCSDQQNNNEPDLNFMTLLMECAVAVSVDNLGEAHRMLLELTQMASPYGPSCAERVVAYFAKAMSSRVINSWLGMSSPLMINHKSVHSAFQVFNNVSPFVKFAHFTSNQAILEAFHRRDRVHIIDLDIMQGSQWPALFHLLATRIEGPPHVRMTGMGTSMDHLIETGKQLSNFAKRLGMSFEFHPLARKFGDVVDVDTTPSLLQIRRGETIGVHWLQHSLYDATGSDWKTIRLLRQLSPRVITLVEQEIDHGGSFLDRFVGSLHYYSTIFDSLGSNYLQTDDSSRHRVEHGLLYREINNILAIGGPARSGEEKIRHWRSELHRNGFLQVPMSTNSMAQAQLILNTFPPSHGYSLVQGDGTLRLGWKDTSLYSVSAWTSHSSST